MSHKILVVACQVGVTPNDAKAKELEYSPDELLSLSDDLELGNEIIVVLP